MKNWIQVLAALLVRCLPLEVATQALIRTNRFA